MAQPSASAIDPPQSQPPFAAQAAALLLSALSISAHALLGALHLLLSAALLHVVSAAASAASLFVSPIVYLAGAVGITNNASDASSLHEDAISPSSGPSHADPRVGTPREPFLSADAAACSGGGGGRAERQEHGHQKQHTDAPTVLLTQQPDCPSLLLYCGHVAHHRSHPTAHGFNYRVRYALVNLDTAPDWFQRSSARHHMSADEARSFAGTDGPIFLLTNPVSFSYEQNPISVYYCYRAASRNSASTSTSTSTSTSASASTSALTVNGNSSNDSSSKNGQQQQQPLLPPAESLAVCIGEVSNTPWTDRVTFLFAPHLDRVPKPLHVSPFMDMQSTWEMRAMPPSRRISLHITALHPVLGREEGSQEQQDLQTGKGGVGIGEGKQPGSDRPSSSSSINSSIGSSIFVACLDIDCLPAQQQPYLQPSLPSSHPHHSNLSQTQQPSPPASSPSSSPTSSSSPSSFSSLLSFSSLCQSVTAWQREVRCRCFLCFMPHMVAFWIYWQAFLLWFKGVPLLGHPKYTEGPQYGEATLKRLSSVAYRGKGTSTSAGADRTGTLTQSEITPVQPSMCPFRWRNASAWPWN